MSKQHVKWPEQMDRVEVTDQRGVTALAIVSTVQDEGRITVLPGRGLAGDLSRPLRHSFTRDPSTWRWPAAGA